MHLLLLCKTKVENVFAIYFKTHIQNFFVLVYFVCHTPQFKMLVFAFQSEIEIADNFNFSVFEDFLFIVVMEISIFTKCEPR